MARESVWLVVVFICRSTPTKSVLRIKSSAARRKPCFEYLLGFLLCSCLLPRILSMSWHHGTEMPVVWHHSVGVPMSWPALESLDTQRRNFFLSWHHKGHSGPQTVNAFTKRRQATNPGCRWLETQLRVARHGRPIACSPTCPRRARGQQPPDSGHICGRARARGYLAPSTGLWEGGGCMHFL